MTAQEIQPERPDQAVRPAEHSDLHALAAALSGRPLAPMPLPYEPLASLQPSLGHQDAGVVSCRGKRIGVLIVTYNAITTISKVLKRIPPDVWKNVSRVFSALGDEHRQRILLTFEPGERLNVGQIVEVSTLSRSAVSHHLKILREAGVLDSEKIGKEVYFWLNKKQIKTSLAAVMDYLKTQ